MTYNLSNKKCLFQFLRCPVNENECLNVSKYYHFCQQEHIHKVFLIYLFGLTEEQSKNLTSATV